LYRLEGALQKCDEYKEYEGYELLKKVGLKLKEKTLDVKKKRSRLHRKMN
jgi:hypothetical protein